MRSMRKAIDDMCKDCNYDDKDVGTWRQQIESCTITRCPLHVFRPITEESRKIRAKTSKKQQQKG